MNTTFLRIRIVVIALMVGLVWSEGRGLGLLAGEEAVKAFDGMSNQEIIRNQN